MLNLSCVIASLSGESAPLSVDTITPHDVGPSVRQALLAGRSGLLSAQVKKSYRRRSLAGVERRLRLGSLDDLAARLQSLGLSGSINTAFAERINLTLRHALAALSRRYGPRTPAMAAGLTDHL